MTESSNTTNPEENKEKIDYKASYEILMEWIVTLTPYCYTCINNDHDDNCDGCNRKAFEWECAPETLPKPILK